MTSELKRTRIFGLDLLLRKNLVEARKHFEWVKEYGNRTFYEYTLSIAELERWRK